MRCAVMFCEKHAVNGRTCEEHEARQPVNEVTRELLRRLMLERLNERDDARGVDRLEDW